MDSSAPDLSRARRSLERRGLVASASLPPDIAASWQRCLDLGLDPLGETRANNLDGSALREACERHEQLIRFARPEIELLHDQIAGSNFMVALGSPEGLILQTLVDSQFASNAAAHAVVPGSWWSEAIRGTNALGIALATRRPAHVYGAEHFLRANTGVSCICAPIFNGHGAIAGLLDASTAAAHRQDHTAALLQMSAGNIENCLVRSRYEDHLILLFHPRPEYLDTLSVGMLVLDPDHRIVAFNRRGGILLAGLADLIGQPFSAIFEENLDAVAPRLGRGETVRVRDRYGSAASMRSLPNRASQSLTAVSVQSAALVGDTGALVLEDPALAERFTGLLRAARRGMTINLCGETGTGKTAIAEFIHTRVNASGHWQAIQPNNSTPALTSVQSHGTTLYVDRVEEMDESHQADLLRQIETQDGKTLILSTTALPVALLAEKGRIRRDLAHRLSEFVIELPALRDREDLEALVEHFLAGIRPGLGFDRSALEALTAHEWPGNLRELRACLHRAALNNSGFELTEKDFPDFKSASGKSLSAARIAEVLMQLTDNGLKWRDVHGETIRVMVAHCDGNVTEAARRLGLSRTTVYKYYHSPMSHPDNADPSLPDSHA